MVIMGIDPGLKGGVAFYDGDSIEAFYTPVVEEVFVKKGKKQKRNLMDLNELREMILAHEPDRAVLEKVTARPGQGVTSMFRFGQGFGEYRGLFSGMGVEWIEVTPQTWKKTYDLGSDKNPSLELASQLWPSKAKECFRLKKQDGVAEAALIAKFGFDNPEFFDHADPN